MEKKQTTTIVTHNSHCTREEKKCGKNKKAHCSLNYICGSSENNNKEKTVLCRHHTAEDGRTHGVALHICTKKDNEGRWAREESPPSLLPQQFHSPTKKERVKSLNAAAIVVSFPPPRTHTRTHTTQRRQNSMRNNKNKNDTGLLRQRVAHALWHCFVVARTGCPTGRHCCSGGVGER